MTRPKLLLADDSVTIRKVVELTFADEGIDVASAGDAQSAMQRFVEVQPDIVLVDVGLDGTNGYQICEMIKADEATKHIPVMLLVGSFEPFDGDEAHRVGADAFMTKPFNSIRDLVNRVSMLLSQDKNGKTVGELESPTIPETEDIEDLYRSSFAETDKIDGYETVETYETTDEFLGDAGMDDDMIEASYLSPRSVETPLSEGQPLKEFDWSPEAIVEEETQLFTPSPHEKELDPSEWLEDDESEPQNDDTSDLSGNIEAVNDQNEEQTGEASTFDSIDFSNTPAVFPVPLAMADLDEEDEDELLDIFEDRNRATTDDPSIHDTEPYTNGEQPPGPVESLASPAMSDEMIDEIVRRVVHKLSDVVVRDIARVEVPRIAEKLIREALEQEPKD